VGRWGTRRRRRRRRRSVVAGAGAACAHPHVFPRECLPAAAAASRVVPLAPLGVAIELRRPLARGTRAEPNIRRGDATGHAIKALNRRA
jgi:hypothetical protein